MKGKSLILRCLLSANRGPIFRSWLSAFQFVATVVVVAGGAKWLATYGPLAIVEQRVRAAIEQAQTTRVKHSEKVIGLEINVNDLATRFDGVVTAAKLAPFLDDLCKLGAAEVVVDIDLSKDNFDPAHVCAAATHGLERSRVVWANSIQHSYRDGQLLFTTGPALQKQQREAQSGPPVEFLKGFVLQFPTCVENEKYNRVGTLYWKALHLDQRNPNCDQPPQEVNLLYPSIRVNDYGLDILESAVSAGAPVDSIFSGKIVVVIGEYSRCDIYSTEALEEYGGQLLATAIALGAEGKPGEQPKWPTTIAEVLLALSVLVIYHYFRPWPALALTGFGLVFAFVFAVALAARFACPNVQEVVPFMIGIWIHQLFEATQKSEEALHHALAKET